jgi:hypothetical protein
LKNKSKQSINQKSNGNCQLVEKVRLKGANRRTQVERPSTPGSVHPWVRRLRAVDFASASTALVADKFLASN